MSRREQIKTRIGRWQWDQQERIIDHDWNDKWISDPLLAVLEGIQTVACAVLGHRPTEDNCGRPAHDYCVWCHRGTPGQAPR